MEWNDVAAVVEGVVGDAENWPDDDRDLAAAGGDEEDDDGIA